MEKASKDEQPILEILRLQHCTRTEIGETHWGIRNWKKGTHESQLTRVLDHLSEIGKIETDVEGKWMLSSNPAETRLKNRIVPAIKNLRPMNHVSIFKSDVPMFLFGTTSWERIEKADSVLIHARKLMPYPGVLYRVDLYSRLFRESCERFLYELESIIDKLAHECGGEKAKDQTLFVLARFLWVSHLWQKKEFEDSVTRFGPPGKGAYQIWQEYFSLKNLRDLLDFTKRVDWRMDTHQLLKAYQERFSDAHIDMPLYKWQLFDSTLFRLDFSSSKIFKPEVIGESVDECIASLSQPDNLELLKKFMGMVKQIQFMLLVSVGIEAIDERPDGLIERFDQWMEELTEGEHDTEDFIFTKGVRNLKDILARVKDGKPHAVETYIEKYSHMPWGRTLFPSGFEQYNKFRSRLAVSESESWDLQYLYEKHVDGKKPSFYKHILKAIKDRSLKRRHTLEWRAVQEFKERTRRRLKQKVGETMIRAIVVRCGRPNFIRYLGL